MYLILKRIKKIGLFIVFLIGLVALTGFIIAKFYEDEVSQFAIDKINENLTAKIQVEDINLTLLERFPNASLKFKNVLLKDSINQTDTILFAQSIFLKLNIWDLIDENFDVKQIEINDGIINLKVDENGQENYRIWKTIDNTTSRKKTFEFSIEDVSAESIDFTYSNKISQQFYDVAFDNLALNGNFSEDVFTLLGNADFKSNKFVSGDVNYIPNQLVNLDLDLIINTIEETYRVNDGNLKVAELPFKVGGFYDNKSQFLDLAIKGNNIDLVSLLSLVPEQYTNDISKYKSTGNLGFLATIKGKTSQNNLPVVQADFHIKNGSLNEPENDITLSKLSFSGNYLSKNKKGVSELKLNELSGQFEDGLFSGQLSVIDFSNPRLNLSANGNLNLNTIARFISSSNIETLNGKIDFKGDFIADFLPNSLQIRQSNGEILFEEVSFKFKEDPNAYHHLSGKFELQKNHAYVSNLNGKLNQISISMDGYFRNFLPYVLSEKETLTVEAQTKIDKADIKQLIQDFESEKEIDDEGNRKINFNLFLEADKLIYGKLIAENVSSTVQIHDGVIRYDKLKFESAGGKISSSGVLVPLENGNFSFKMQSETKKVNSSEFFRQLDDFGQNYLTHKNLTGLVDNTIDLSMTLTPNYEIIEPSVRAISTFNIKNGELKNVRSINEMTEYIASDWKVKPFIDEDLLVQKAKHIKFKTLQTNIIIKDETIIIPYTEIQSDLININGEGIHWFDDRIDYKFNFRLRDALIKADKNSEEEFGGYEVDDKTGYRLFVRMQGTIYESDISLDVASKREQRKENLHQEKETVKQILKEEFSRMKSDSAQMQQKPEEKAKFVIDWEELDEEKPAEDSTSTDDKKKEEKDRKKKERMQKFLKKIGAEENKDEDVQFKIDQ